MSEPTGPWPPGETVTVRRAARENDPYASSPTRLDWTTVTEVRITGCGVAPRSSTEPVVQGRSEVLIGLTLFLPAGSDIRALDRVVVRGVVHDVDGDPSVWRSPLTGWAPGLEVRAIRVEG
jgi:hypothetical protein